MSSKSLHYDTEEDDSSWKRTLKMTACGIQSDINELHIGCEQLFYSRNRELYRRNERENHIVQLQIQLSTVQVRLMQFSTKIEHADISEDFQQNIIEKITACLQKLKDLLAVLKGVDISDLSTASPCVLRSGDLLVLTEELVSAVSSVTGHKNNESTATIGPLSFTNLNQLDGCAIW